MKTKPDEQSGISIVFAIFTLLALSVAVVTVFSMISTDVNASAYNLKSMQSFYIAETGRQLGAQLVRDDKDATDGTNLFSAAGAGTVGAAGICGESFIEGGFVYALSDNIIMSAGGVVDSNEVCFFDNTTAAMWELNLGDRFIGITNFQQAFNLHGARLLEANIVCRAWGSQAGLTLRLEYSTTGAAGPWTEAESYTLPTAAPAFGQTSATIPVTFQDIISTTNPLYIRAIHDTDAALGPLVQVDVDWLALRVVTEVDSNTEPWRTTTLAGTAFSIGSITGITIDDESGKININNAPQNAIAHLFDICGQSGTAIAAELIGHRLSERFESINGIRQLATVTDAAYLAVRDHITAHSWVNDVSAFAHIPGFDISPVNINTASTEVLQAVFRSTNNMTNITPGDEVVNLNDFASLANDIITRRATTPFTSMHSSAALSLNYTTCFSDFLEDYAGPPAFTVTQKDRIRDVADISGLNAAIDQNWTTHDPGTIEAPPLCYSSHVYFVRSASAITAVSAPGSGSTWTFPRNVYSIFGDIYDYSTRTWGAGSYRIPPCRTFSEYIGALNAPGYWGESWNW